MDNKKLTCKDDLEDFSEVYGVIFILKNGKVVPKTKFLIGKEFSGQEILWISEIYYKFMLKYAYGVFCSKRQKQFRQLELPNMPLLPEAKKQQP